MELVKAEAVLQSGETCKLESVEYQIHREMAPIYVNGDANPRSFSRGKRGISGVFTIDRMDCPHYRHLNEGTAPLYIRIHLKSDSGFLQIFEFSGITIFQTEDDLFSKRMHFVAQTADGFTMNERITNRGIAKKVLSKEY